MKTKLILLMLIITLTFTFTSYADIPHVINFQGKATDNQGTPLNGTYNLTFKIYDHGTEGNLEWQETHQNLTITNGIFQVLLGSVTALDLDFNEDYWITVEVNTDGEMTPRTRLASVGYAYKAEVADNAQHAISADSLTRQIGEVPTGGIIMWSGTIADIPERWALCDGTNGTPDLRNKFIVGAEQDDSGVAKTNITGSLTQVGGNTTHAHGVGTYKGPGHDHAFSVETDVDGDINYGTTSCGEGGNDAISDVSWGGGTGQGQGTTDWGGDESITGTSASASSLSPYYALAYIMRL